MQATNEAICRRLLEQGYGEGDLAAVDETVSARCRLHDPQFPELQPGVESLKQHIVGLRKAFPDLSCMCDSISHDEDAVVAEWTCRGTQKDTFLGQPAAGRMAELHGRSVFRLSGGKIVEIWTGWNLRTLLDQLGLQMTAQQGNKVLVNRFLEEVWNQRHPDRIPEFIAEECARYSPNGMVKGPAGVRKEFDAFTAGFPDFRINVDEMTCEGDRVVVRFTATGTHDGPLGDLSATGRKVSFVGVSLYHLDGGKIVEQFLTFDDFGLRRVLTAAAA